MNYQRNNLIYLKQVYIQKLKFEQIRKSKVFATLEKIHCSFLNNLKSEETKSQIKAHLS